MTTVKVETAQYLGTGMANMLGGAAFSVGLMLVVIAGAELFTGNCLIPMGVFQRKISISGLFKNWTVVYFGNEFLAVLTLFPSRHQIVAHIKLGYHGRYVFRLVLQIGRIEDINLTLGIGKSCLESLR